MEVLKIVCEGVTTSFRYPHFMQGIHPTYEMPPPATIYGHVCGALGEWIDPRGVRFAYHFTHQGKFDDVEHVHLLAKSTGKLKDSGMPKVLEGAINPFKRQQLFAPRLTLYLNKPEWAEAFRSPAYQVVLGRSQDLCMYSSVEVVSLEPNGAAYFEHTLAPYEVALSTAAGSVATMPRMLDHARNRQPQFARYVVLTRRVTRLIRIEGQPEPPRHWVDTETPRVDGAALGLWFHAFVDDI
jgi:CRISPR-associated protein Cas5t